MEIQNGYKNIDSCSILPLLEIIEHIAFFLFFSYLHINELRFDESPSKMAEKTYSQSRDCKLMTAEESIGDIGNEEVSQIKPQQQKFGEKD